MADADKLNEGEVRVTTVDWEGREETIVIVDDYVIVTAGNRYVSHTQIYPGKGTHVITVKRKE